MSSIAAAAKVKKILFILLFYFIQVRDLQLVSKEQLSVLKEGEEEKTKIYRALCVILDGSTLTAEDLIRINGITELVLMQKTPLRVLHRYKYFIVCITVRLSRL